MVTGSCPGHCPHFNNVSVYCPLWLLHSLFQNLLRRPFCFAGTGTVYLTPRIPPSPTPFGCPPVVGQGLTESAPPGRSQVRQLKQKSKRTSDVPEGESSGRLCLGIRGVASPEEQPRLSFPGWLPRCGIQRWDFANPCPDIAGHLKGVGLGKIPQVDYAANKPAGETPGSGIRTPCFRPDLSRIASPRLC